MRQRRHRDRTAAGTGAAGGEWYCRSRWEKIICGITETAGTSGDLWSGIYRHVWITKTMKAAYIPQWGQYVSTTPKGDVKVKVDFLTTDQKLKISVRNTIYDTDGRVVARRAISLFRFLHPSRWQKRATVSPLQPRV